MFDSIRTLKGPQIGSFRLPLATWQIAAKIVGIGCLLFWVALIVYSRVQSGPLFWIGIIAGLLGGNRQIQFHENGLSIPKAAGEVFLSRDQILNIKLDGDRFIVTGPDATWGGPYSSGIFRIRTKDLPKFDDVLGRFRHSLTPKGPQPGTS